MEGVTGYLTETEISAVLSAIAKVTCKNSVLITTWVSKTGAFPGRTRMHVSRTDTPEQFFDEEIWVSESKKSIGEIAHEYWTFDNISPDDKSYFIACHKRV